MNRPRRLVRIGMSFPLLFDIMQKGWCTGGEVECIEGLPEGSEYMYSWTDDSTGVLYLVFQHPSFEMVELGEMIPEMRIVHKKTYSSPPENSG